ncbi:hypothetical protein Tco_1302366 [Tanacetum coccineum]
MRRWKQKLDEKVEEEVDDAKEAKELKQCLEIVPDDGDDLTVDATPLSVKMPITMFEHHLEDNVWKNQQGLVKVLNWKLYDSCGVHFGCEQYEGPHYTKDCPLKEEGKTLEGSYYTQFGGPFQGGGYRVAALGFYQRNNVNPSYQERRQSMEDTLSKFMSESAKRHEENSNLIKEIRASTNVAIQNQGAPIKTLEIQIGQMSKVLQERGFGSLTSSTKVNPRDRVKSISTTIEADSYPIRLIGSSQYAVSIGQNHTLMYETRQMTIPFPSRLNGYYCEEKKGSYGPQFSKAYSEASQSLPQKEKDTGSFTLPCFINNVCFDNTLFDLGVSVSVMPLLTYLNLGLGELAHTKLTVELVDRTVKYPKGIAKNILLRIGNFTFPVEFIILDMPEDIKVPLILRRPFLSTTRAKIDVYKRKITLRVGEERIIFTIVKPISSLIKRVYMLSLRQRIPMGEMSKKFHNSIMKDKMVYKGNNVIGALMNVPIFVGTFYVVTDFTVLENIDDYRDEGMGDVIFGEQFLRDVGIKTRRFERMITIYNVNEEVTYQMVRSHLRFKHHTNEQCNKIPPLLKVSEEDKMNEISHSYQKLKGFYKGVLNLGPYYIRDAKMEEWLTRGHISVHEME